MIYRHHIFTIPSMIPVGLYVGNTCQWSGATAGEALGLLRGSSSISLGIATDELKEVGRLLAQANIGPDQFDGQLSAEVMQALRDSPAPIGIAVEKYLEIVGYQITTGYDISECYALETPEILVGNIWRSLSESGADAEQDDYPIRREEMRNKVPAAHRAEFDSLLDEARHINRLRDERGVYNDARALGLSRRAVLEAGQRLQADGRLSVGGLLIHASHDEILALLLGEEGPAEAELQQRAQWFESKTIDDAPPFLGLAPSPPPPLDALPENARLAQKAIGAALGNLFDQPVVDSPDPNLIEGTSVSPGSYEGTVRIIQKPADFRRLQQGDVLVTKNTSASFNVVMPMVGAIVTDRGGQLSHAAIIAREYGIPAVVGTRNATRTIVDGSRVRVDGDSGRVEVIS